MSSGGGGRRRPKGRDAGQGREGGGGRSPRGERREPPGDWVAGRRAVQELLEESPGSVETLLLAPEATGLREICEAARAAGVSWRETPRRALDRQAEGAVHQGVMARIRTVRTRPLGEVLEADPGLLVLTDRITDPRNLGAIVRSAAAAGADGVLVPRRRSARLGPAAAKAAAGALERIAIVEVGSPAQALTSLRQAGLQLVGLDGAGDCPWTATDLKGPTCLVVGSEGEGLSRLVRERCDQLMAFPLLKGVESLNASVAAALALYEVRRQRLGDPAPGGGGNG
ncbi:MAG: 23S rRNA (guanosine(2251)-2'-O)-methyltransferase RlmB [Acidobacteriota bacterium]